MTCPNCKRVVRMRDANRVKVQGVWRHKRCAPAPKPSKQTKRT